MRSRTLLALWGLWFALAAHAQQPARHFRFHYAFTVKNVTQGSRVRVWIPLAQSDANQDVKILSSAGDLKLRRTHEARFGNEMFYAEVVKANKTDYAFTVEYDAVRRENRALAGGQATLRSAELGAAQQKEWLGPDRLVPVSGLPAELAAKEVEGRTSQLEKAHAVYDYVFRTMKYDKTGTGWGRGDTLWACDAKRGNCTDFHSLFIAMARSQGIPSRFEIGFPLPAAKHSSEIPGYHCWAEFYIAGRGWIPVDISEAWKAPEKKDYFFGSHDVNRVQFTMGRDLKLSPAQEGEPLNYFIYPYVEVDGKPYANVDNRFSFEDVEVAGSAAGAGGK